MAESLEPNSAAVQVDLSFTLAQLGRCEEAAAAVRRAVALNPDNSQAWRNLGVVLCRISAVRATAKRWEEAEAAAREAVQLDPKNGEAHFRVGIALMEQGRRADAVESFRRSNECRPEAITYYNLASNLHRLGRDKEARESAQAAIRHNRDYPKAHGLLGDILLHGGDPVGAAREYRELIRLQPDSAEAHYHFGVALSKQGDLGGAVKSYREAIQLRPDFPEAHCNLGNDLRWMGRFAEALDELRRGHELGSRIPGWRHPSAQWVRECEQLVELQRRLPSILSSLP
jgi:tetratricopeptide (TPR) repeat protein